MRPLLRANIRSWLKVSGGILSNHEMAEGRLLKYKETVVGCEGCTVWIQSYLNDLQ